MSGSTPMDPVLDPNRLKAVRASGLLDSPVEADFDRYTRILADLLDAPVALISLVDEDRQFFKSCVGMESRESPLSHSFCVHVVRSGASFVVVDAPTDPRVADNPAIDELGVRSYIGHPLTDRAGQVLGSVCVLDYQPREWSERDRERLGEVAGAVESELRLRDSLQRQVGIEATLQDQNLILQDIAVGTASPEVLARIALSIEERLEDVRASVWLLDPHAELLELAAGPSLNSATLEALDPIPISGGSGSCAGAVRTRQDVHVPDISSSPIWKEFHGDEAVTGQAASWSIPIVGLDDAILGTLGLYGTGVASPTPADEEVALRGTWLARIVLDRDRRVEELRISEQRFDLALDSTGVGVFDVDLTRDVAQFTAPYVRMLGYEPHEYPARRDEWFSRVHPDDAGEVREALDRHLEGETDSYEATYRIRHRDGHWLWVLARGRVVHRDGDGTPLRVVGTHTDVTDARHREEKLRRLSLALASEGERLATVLDGLPVAVLIWREDDRVIFSNLTAREYLGQHGIDPDDLTPDWERFEVRTVSGDSIPYEEQPHRRVLAGERVETFEISSVDASDRTRWWRLMGIPIEVPSEDGDPEQAAMVIFEDVTHVHQAQQELRSSQDQLLHAQKMEAVGRLAGGMAHDFNNLLTAILGYAELLSEDLPADSGARSDALQIVRAASHGKSLTRSLLAFSRKSSGQPARLDISAALVGIRRLVRGTLTEGIDLHLEVAPGSGAVDMDPGHLEQSVLNLAINARDAIEAATGRIDIRAEPIDLEESLPAVPGPVPAGEWVRIQVRDDGAGMEPQLLPRVFEPFFTTKAPGKGTGLGLASVWGVVTRAGGTVTLESEQRMGTTVSIYLPRMDSDPVDSPSEDGEAVDGPSSTGTILIVEDEDQVRALLTRILVRRGFRVLEAVNGRDALLQVDLNLGEIDLIVSDVVMPVMDGMEFSEALTDREIDIPLLFISGYTGGPHDATEIERIPGDGLIEKPFRAEEVIRRVEERLDRT